VTPVADALPVAVTPLADALPVAVAADGEAGAPVEAGASQRLLRTIGWRR
jgi:hypothetical protein